MIVEWVIDEQIKELPVISCAERLAEKYRDAPYEQVMDMYVGYSDIVALERDFGLVFDRVRPELKGRGVEIGSGVAIFSSMAMKHFPAVEQIWAVEAVSGVVRHLQPKITQAVCGERRHGITNVIGDFDRLELEDGSLDFCIEVDSLHHSYHPPRTFAEIARVLKPGGLLLMLDRSHPDSLSEEQREFMLDVVYSSEFLEKYGFPKGRMTRRDNGEHEYRQGEWMGWLAEAGFQVERRLELRSNSWRQLMRAAVLTLPFGLRRKLGWLPSRVRGHRGELRWRLADLLGMAGRQGSFARACRDYSIFLARKVA